MRLFLSFLLSLLFFSIQIDARSYKNTLNNETLHSASELDYPPFSVVLDDNTASGFSVELLRSAVKEMGGNVDFYVDSWTNIKQDLKDAKIDVLPLVARTIERDKEYDFSTPYLIMHGAIFTRKDNNKIKSIKDLYSKELAVMKDDSAHEYILDLNYTQNIFTYNNYEEAFKSLETGKHDAVVVQKLVGIQLIKKLRLKNIKASEFILEDFRQDFCFAVQEHNPELVSILNEGLMIVNANGVYEQLYEKWFHKTKHEKGISKKTLYILVSIILILLLGFIASYIWQRTLKKTIRQKTRQLYNLNKNLKLKIEEAVNENKNKDEIMLMQSRQAAMGEMISMIAHQWRQPLSTISASVINLEMQLFIDNSIDIDELKSHLNMVTNQTQHLSKTIDNFRDFIKPNSKTKDVISVLDAVNRASNIIKHTLKQKNVELSINNKSDSTIYTYSNELMQVFLNIINNAKDALVQNNIKDPSIDISIHETKDSIITSICDNAGGISNDIINKISEPYFTTKLENGTGLGLYISKIITEKHLNGEIKWENKNEGICFTISLAKTKNPI